MLCLPAEWEAQAAVQITLPHADSDWKLQLAEAEDCFVEIVRHIIPFAKVLLVCHDQNHIKSLFKIEDHNQIIFVDCPSNDTWARDHGGIMVETDQGWQICNFTFNGWGLKFAADLDNQITSILHQASCFGSIPLNTIDFVLEGGSIESDGQGTLLTTSQCLLSPHRNPQISKAGIEAQLKKYLGADRILWLDHGHLIGDDTDAHIDTLARFCTPDTIAYVQCEDQNDPHFEPLALMEKQLQTFRTKAGHPYRLIPLPLPSPCHAEDGHRLPATYANFLIINAAVLAPTYGLPEDSLALETLETIFPNHSIIPIDCRILIEQHGSLHCVTMQYSSLGG